MPPDRFTKATQDFLDAWTSGWFCLVWVYPVPWDLITHLLCLTADVPTKGDAEDVKGVERVRLIFTWPECSEGLHMIPGAASCLSRKKRPSMFWWKLGYLQCCAHLSKQQTCLMCLLGLLIQDTAEYLNSLLREICPCSLRCVKTDWIRCYATRQAHNPDQQQ